MTEERKANVYYAGKSAGILKETSNGYTFQYTSEFLKTGAPIAVTFPFQEGPFFSKDLFPFFEGLLPEGWYLQIVCATKKVDRRDSFGLLLATASGDTIGVVTVQRMSLDV